VVTVERSADRPPPSARAAARETAGRQPFERQAARPLLENRPPPKAHRVRARLAPKIRRHLDDQPVDARAKARRQRHAVLLRETLSSAFAKPSS